MMQQYKFRKQIRSSCDTLSNILNFLDLYFPKVKMLLFLKNFVCENVGNKIKIVRKLFLSRLPE